MTALRVTGAGQSHVGRVRALNEDSFCERLDIGLWAVADGMGGHEHGERASAEIAAALAAMPATGAFDSQIQQIADAVHQANAIIYSQGMANGLQMGSTVVALLLAEGRFGVLWAGDSRAYLFRNGQLHQLSIDHTQVQEMVDRGLISSEDAKIHPMSHVLARAVGVTEQLELDVIVDAVVPGDRFLVCSDGLTGIVSEPEIAQALQMLDPARLPEQLIALCLDRGAPDNVTICVAEVREATLLIVGKGQYVD